MLVIKGIITSTLSSIISTTSFNSITSSRYHLSHINPTIHCLFVYSRRRMSTTTIKTENGDDKCNASSSSSSSNINSKWRTISIPRNELNLPVSLKCGQSFRWKEQITTSENKNENERVWVGVVGSSVLKLKQGDDTLFYQFLPNSLPVDKEREVINNYFQLHIPLPPLYELWSTPANKKGGSLNETFALVAEKMPGVRMLKLDPLETVFSFICSSNNNIGRIVKMVDFLCRQYGTKIATVDGEEYFSFPTLSQMHKIKETELQKAGFGYRSRYIVESVKQLHQLNEECTDPNGWLNSLSLDSVSREFASKELQKLTGVGRKVADCISALCLNKHGSIPVDTHIWQLAQRHMKTLKGKSLTNQLYEDIGNFFRSTFGDKASWAHTVLFAAELPALWKKEALKEAKLEIKEETEDNEVEENETKSDKGKGKKRGKVIEERVETKVIEKRKIKKEQTETDIKVVETVSISKRRRKSS
eukprot:TRINITY_DN2706_c0_g1_i1.p1 TRINITY_DN2706_c0_g1~~TRINITY_DN2706_c0_g1_i1.p1  ORF type:complete len:475 (+),score=87.55 TRINITY_DN2706_c0_g1_i1:149-1573(+)